MNRSFSPRTRRKAEPRSHNGRAAVSQAHGLDMNTSNLDSVARSLVARGKGILAADESLGTIEKRFKRLESQPTRKPGAVTVNYY